MARWRRPPASGPERDKLDREAAAEVHRRIKAETIGGTILPEDRQRAPGKADVRILIGTAEQLPFVPEELEKSAAYAAVNSLQVRDFVITLSDGSKATVPSSATHWLRVQRHADARSKQLSSAKDPKKGAAPGWTRGRPRKDKD